MRRMSRSDRKLWRSATTLAELGELTARWLEGDIRSRPGYQPRCGPDPETTETPGLVDVLAAANRAGYLTIGSQPGEPPTEGWDGQLWEQRAAVDGFAHDDMARRLTELERHGFVVISYATRRRWLSRLRSPFGFAMPVTAIVAPDTYSADGVHVAHGREVQTAFGGYLDRASVEFMWDTVSGGALADVLAAPGRSLSSTRRGVRTTCGSGCATWSIRPGRSRDRHAPDACPPPPRSTPWPPRCAYADVQLERAARGAADRATTARWDGALIFWPSSSDESAKHLAAPRPAKLGGTRRALRSMGTTLLVCRSCTRGNPDAVRSSGPLVRCRQL